MKQLKKFPLEWRGKKPFHITHSDTGLEKNNSVNTVADWKKSDAIVQAPLFISIFK